MKWANIPRYRKTVRFVTEVTHESVNKMVEEMEEKGWELDSAEYPDPAGDVLMIFRCPSDQPWED